MTKSSENHKHPQPFRDRLEEAARWTLEADLGESLRGAFSIEESDVDQLLSVAEKQAEEGGFRFFVLMDCIDDRLRDLIGFINENSKFDIYGIEIQFYRFDGYELAIPKLHGAEARKSVDRGTQGTRRTWNEERYFEDAENRLSQAQVAGLRRLYAFAVGHADRVTWGTGVRMGSFSLKYNHIHPTKSVLSVYSDGRIDLNFAWLTGREGSLPEPVRAFAGALDRELENWSLPEDYAAGFTSIACEIWAPRLDHVIKALGHLRK